jgi:hypothetical protein
MERWHQRRTDVAALTHGDGGELEQWRWHVVSDRERGHGGEVGDGFKRSEARRSDRRCRLRIAETAAGRHFMARAPKRSCRPDAARGTPGGDSALMSGLGAEREKLTCGIPRQILF